MHVLLPEDFKGEPGLQFDNSGRGKLQLPGFGYPVPIERPAKERFAHGFQDWSQHRLTAREIAMLRFMNTITDQPRWYDDVNDSTVPSLWAAKAMSTHLISYATWNWCLLELRDKADLYKRAELTHVFDSASRICKSDGRISPSLLQELASGVDHLAAHEGEHLVNLDMFPLVYGQTKVLTDGGRVGRLGSIDTAGMGEDTFEQIWKCSITRDICCDGQMRFGYGRGRGGRGRAGRPGVLRRGCTRCKRTGSSPERPSWQPRGHRFSPNFQWLPCEVAFEPRTDQSSGTKVHISSYINNLHPRLYSSLYKTIEQCIEASIQPWNEVLCRERRGRTPERIRTYGVKWDPPNPTQRDLNELDDIMENASGELYYETLRKLREFIEQPDNPQAPPPTQRYPLVEADWMTNLKPSKALTLKHHRVKRYLHPEPGESFSYDDWKLGKNNFAVVPGRRIIGRDADAQLPPKDDHEFYNVFIEDEFSSQGLQVVVEIGAVELTPEHPTQNATEWQLSGMINDHIVATSILYFSSDNVTIDSGSMSFHVEAELDPLKHIWGPDSGSNPYHPRVPLAEIYGFDSHLEMSRSDCYADPGGPTLQELGTVATPDGRLLTFPNVMHHRIEAFKLLDPSRLGRRRFLKLHLVDPNYRVCSTRNVPPQRPDWWFDAGIGRLGYDMPPELVQEIGTYVPNFPMSVEMADQVKHGLVMERKRQFEVIMAEMPRYAFGRFGAQGWRDRYN